jgi:hypothetical protein
MNDAPLVGALLYLGKTAAIVGGKYMKRSYFCAVSCGAGRYDRELIYT